MNEHDKKTINRRDIVAGSALGAAAAIAGVGTAAAQTFQTQRGAQQMRALQLNPGAKAVLPDASLADRAKILTTLGLNPNTPPDAWLAIINCGSNASALTQQQLQKVQPQLQRRGIIIQ